MKGLSVVSKVNSKKQQLRRTFASIDEGIFF